MEKKKEMFVIIGSLLVIILSVTLAYFTVQIVGKGKEISASSADLKITFSSGSGNISSSNIEPGWSSGTSTFTVKNESKDTYKYNIVIKDLVNTFVTTGYLQYKITSTDGGYHMNEFQDIPKSSTPKDTILAYSVEIAKGKTHSYSIEFKYLNSANDQSDDMGKELSGILYIEKGTIPPTLAEKLLADNPTINTRTSFDAVFTETNTGTLYKATERISSSTPKDVYYFAGNALNNWVKFGKYQTDKIVYRGYFSATSDSFTDYSTMDACTRAQFHNVNCTEIKFVNAGDPMYWRIIRTNHDGSIRMLYSGTTPDTTEGYIGKSEFNGSSNDPIDVGYMYGTSGTLESNRTNENNSTIKAYIDNWYSTNLSSYSKYISIAAVYCNDRELAAGSTYSTTDSMFYYAAETRLNTNKTPTYNCTNIKDAFSGSNSDAKLIYPVGLMTADEITYVGGYRYTDLSSPYAWYYLNSAGGSITGYDNWWLLSPSYWDGLDANVWYVGGSDHPGCLNYDNFVLYSEEVRPVISIKSDTLYSKGNGSPENPYEIVYN